MLANDAGTGFLTGIKPGSSASVSNSQCTVVGSGSSWSTSGQKATLKVSLTTPASGNSTNIYMYAADDNGTNSGWVKVGSWKP
jgi:hypothetical protein